MMHRSPHSPGALLTHPAPAWFPAPTPTASRAPLNAFAEGPAERLARGTDPLLGAIVFFAVLFGPWAFGSTPAWAVNVLTATGVTAWNLLGVRWAARRVAFRQWPREQMIDGQWRTPPGERLFRNALAILTGLTLLYILTSAWNARATYQPALWGPEFHPSVSWLPHSYASASTWSAFWKYLGVAGLFWAARVWILADPRRNLERLRQAADGDASEEGELLPPRLRLLLWVLSVNGAVLAVEGIVQRLTGSNRLLGLVEPSINKTCVTQFGPYAYRANAAQYFNLLWPVTLGFWWTYQRACHKGDWDRTGRKGRRAHPLLVCAGLMAICPALSSSRGGAIVMVACALLSGAVLQLAHWRSTWAAKLGVFALIGGMVGGGLLLGWEELGPRLEMYKEGFQGREGLFLTGWRMAADSPVFGVGPGAFRDLYPLFRRTATDFWPAQLHNDWLETLITFGWAGSGIVGLGLLAVLMRWFHTGGICGNRHCVMLLWISLAGCLIHAFYDFPLQIQSILILFVLLCSILSCLSRRP